MLVGAHVRGGGALADVVGRGADLGAQAVQIFTQSPRMWRPSRHTPEAIAQFRQAMAAQVQVQAVFCHATYLVNLGSADPELLARSQACLVDNFAVATAMAADGLVLHVGSHRGAGLAGCLEQVVASLVGTLEAVDPLPGSTSCPILVENAAGAGGTIGRDFDELSIIVDRVGSERLGVCLDTQHLWASGVDFSTEEGADQVVARLEAGVGLDRLRCIHLNDSAVALGANRDRHANIGAGTIGADGLAALLGHPALESVPVVLEVPGDGSGPTAEQVQLAKEVVAAGVARRSH
jgi:deoxyribonuclease-4